jgi:hypothetical protein
MELGEAFRLVAGESHRHQTPSGLTQSFQYSRFTRVD